LSNITFWEISGGRSILREFKGFGSNFAHMAFETPDVSNVLDAAQLSEKNEKYYTKIIELCKNESIPLEIFVSPYVIPEAEQMGYNTAAQIAKDCNVPFMNFNLQYEKVGLDFSTDMADPSHLNYLGNIKFSRFWGRYINAKYDLPDRRNDHKWDSWARETDVFFNRVADHELRKTAAWDEFSSKVLGNPNYMIALAVNGEFTGYAAPDWTC
jgi:hypothetical protein